MTKKERKPAENIAPEDEAPLVTVTSEGKKYFNEIKRIIPTQHDGDPMGNTPLQSR